MCLILIYQKKKKSKNVEGVEEGLIGESMGKAGRAVWMKSPTALLKRANLVSKKSKKGTLTPHLK